MEVIGDGSCTAGAMKVLLTGSEAVVTCYVAVGHNITVVHPCCMLLRCYAE